MTREEIKNTPELIDFMLDKCVIADSRAKVRKRLEEVCELAIKTLEQEPNYNSVNSLVESKLKNPKAKTFDILHFIADNAGLSTFEAIEKAYNMGVSEQKAVLDKIREEIKEFADETIESSSDYDDYASIRYCLAIVDKYIGAKREPQENENKEYEKELNNLKAQILEEGDTLVSKQDFLDRFVEVDREYKNSPWNLLQILTNIDILIGEEPCEDAISREQAIKATYGFERHTGIDEAPYEYAESILRDLPPVTPQTRKGHWVNGEYCSECGCDVPTFIIDWRWQEEKDMDAKYCPNCGAKMKGKSEEV